MIPLGSYVTVVPEPEETTLDTAAVASAPVFYGFSLSGHLNPGPHYPDAGRQSTTIHQANFDALSVEGPFPTLFASDLLFDLTESDMTLPVLTQGHGPWIACGLGSVHVEDPVVNSIPRTSDEDSWDSVTSSFDPLSISHSTVPDPQALFLGQDVGENFQTSAVALVPIPWGIPSLGWGIGQEAGFSSENLPLSSVDPAVGIDVSSIPERNVQMVNLTVVQSPPFTPDPFPEQQQIVSAERVHPCEWKGADGAVCGERLRSVDLPDHLSKHGIKNQSRDHRTKCNWDGCRKKSMNRESIVRHIREVHMHIRRRPKPAQRRCS